MSQKPWEEVPARIPALIPQKSSGQLYKPQKLFSKYARRESKTLACYGIMLHCFV
jgi:hypothetical protein